MTKQTKKSAVNNLLANAMLRAVAVVVLTIAAGALILPAIFAETIAPPAYTVTGVSATSGNGAGYSVLIKWSSNSNEKFLVETIDGSSLVRKDIASTKQFNVENLKCGINYTFRVTSSTASGDKIGSSGQANGTPPCPTATLTALSISGTTVSAQWKPNVSFVQRYTFRYRINNGGIIGVSGTKTNYSFAIQCGQTASADVIAEANGQTGPPSNVGTVKAANCPPTTTSPPSGGGSTGGSGGGTSGSSGSTKKSPSKTTTNSNNTTSTATAAPATPSNFSASVVSNKVVELTWDAVQGADHYTLSRSTDQTNWTQIANVSSNSYSDESADFMTTYYYQLQAVGADGQVSGTETANATTEAFTASSNKITSDDKHVTVAIPEGAIDGEYSCTLSIDDSSKAAPAGTASVLGPYSLLCVTDDGDIVDEFSKPLATTIAVGDSGNGYKNLSVQLAGDKGWSQVKNIKYDQNKQQISFNLTSAKSFGLFGVKQKSIVGTIILILFLLLLIGLIIFFVLRRRRNNTGTDYPTSSAATSAGATAVSAATTPSAEEEFRQAVAQPDCSHLDQAQQVIPSSQGCLECEQQGTKWNSLRICLICGHVGCSDDSEQQHALKHYQETGHPLIYEYGNPAGNNIGWCYIDQTYI